MSAVLAQSEVEPPKKVEKNSLIIYRIRFFPQLHAAGLPKRGIVLLKDQITHIYDRAG